MMIVRYLKICFVSFISLLCLLHAAQNMTNLETCFQAFTYVMGNVGHEIYASSFAPSITSPVLIWIAVALVIGFEFVAGLFAAKGAWDMWIARSASAEVFNLAKIYALAGCGLGVFIWLGLFTVVGSTIFQMWQTDNGQGSLGDALRYFVACAMVFLMVNMSDDLAG